MVLGPTPGETFLAFIGLNPEYPGYDRLAIETDDAISEAANDVLNEWKARDPLLRVMLDNRCQLWTLAEWCAGDLHVGDRLEYVDHLGGRWSGVIRPTNTLDVQWNRLTIGWSDYVPDPIRPRRGVPEPTITPDTMVEAVVPVPLDLSALLAIVDADAARLAEGARDGR